MNQLYTRTNGISFIILSFIFFFYSCQPILKTAESKKILPNEIAIAWLIDSSVNDIYIPQIDSVMHVAMNRFNGEHHAFSVNKQSENEKASITVIFDKGKFASNGNLITGYIVSGLGLIASPIGTLSATSGQFGLAFWYFPRDLLRFTVSLSPNLQENDDAITLEKFVQSGAMFSSKTRRVHKIESRLESIIYKILLDISGDAPPKTKVTNTRR